MKTPEETASSLTRVLEFWRDYRDGFSAKELIERYSEVIEYDDLLERFVNLFMENQRLKQKIEDIRKILK